jgi:hypothetical protein
VLFIVPPIVALKFRPLPWVSPSTRFSRDFSSRFKLLVVLLNESLEVLACPAPASLICERHPNDGTNDGYIGNLALMLCSLVDKD